jgi:hypothetical protein
MIAHEAFVPLHVLIQENITDDLRWPSKITLVLE